MEKLGYGLLLIVVFVIVCGINVAVERHKKHKLERQIDERLAVVKPIKPFLDNLAYRDREEVRQSLELVLQDVEAILEDTPVDDNAEGSVSFRLALLRLHSDLEFMILNIPDEDGGVG